jgi:hypothetical protein
MDARQCLSLSKPSTRARMIYQGDKAASNEQSMTGRIDEALHNVKFDKSIVRDKYVEGKAKDKEE